MFRPALRLASLPSASRALPKAHVARRFVSTAPPPQKSRSWKSSAARWGLAGALVYFYNTSSVLAEEPAYSSNAPPQLSRDTETLPTVESIAEQRRAQTRSQPLPPSAQTESANVAAVPDAQPIAPGSPEALEEEAGQEGAFNEETGEINWDCPCLGGMAYGPCGEQFKAAFSCFVYSKDEPKGVDCIEHFKTMQNCFREHPDVYGAELDDDEEVAAEGAETREPTDAAEPTPATQVASTESSAQPKNDATETKPSQKPSRDTKEHASDITDATTPAYVPTVQVKHHPKTAAEEAVPKAWHDSTDAVQSG